MMITAANGKLQFTRCRTSLHRCVLHGTCCANVRRIQQVCCFLQLLVHCSLQRGTQCRRGVWQVAITLRRTVRYCSRCDVREMCLDSWMIPLLLCARLVVYCTAICDANIMGRTSCAELE
jgi:hypothetical protein